MTLSRELTDRASRCGRSGATDLYALDISHEACALLAAVARSGRTIVGFDLCEVAPCPDGDEWDGNVGARLLYKMVGATLRSQGET